MIFEIWKIIRNSTYFSISILFLSLFATLSYDNFGFLGILFVLSFLVYWFSFSLLAKISLTAMFFPFSLLFFIARGSSTPKCNRCYKPLYRTGNKLHQVDESKGFLLTFIKKKLYDVDTADEIRCYSPSCYPKVELFQTRMKRDYVFLSKKRMLRKFYTDKHLILNLDQLDLTVNKSNSEAV
jgi:hypothetical protein